MISKYLKDMSNYLTKCKLIHEHQSGSLNFIDDTIIWYLNSKCLVVNPITVCNFAFLFNCKQVGRTYDSMSVPTWRLIYWWDARGLMLLAVVRPTRVYSFLLQYSVLCTVESLFLLYLLFISWFISSRRWCMDKIGILHANQTSMCLDLHLN